MYKIDEMLSPASFSEGHGEPDDSSKFAFPKTTEKTGSHLSIDPEGFSLSCSPSPLRISQLRLVLRMDHLSSMEG